MTPMMAWLGALVSSAVIENLLFVRAIGADHIINRSRSYRFICVFGLAVAGVSSLSMLPLWWLNQLWGKELWWGLWRGMIALLIVTVVSLLVAFITASSGKVRHLRLIDQGAIYCAALAIVLLALGAKHPLLPSLISCIGSSVGLSAAMVLVHAGRDRLELCSLPRSFAGIPITMVYIGILSLAIYGLIGHQIPT